MFPIDEIAPFSLDGVQYLSMLSGVFFTCKKEVQDGKSFTAQR